MLTPCFPIVKVWWNLHLQGMDRYGHMIHMIHVGKSQRMSLAMSSSSKISEAFLRKKSDTQVLAAFASTKVLEESLS